MSEGAVTVGVKYCGGCNPRYDRVALVRRLAERFPGLLFCPARAEEPCDLLLVVCGCAAACAGVEGLTGRLGMFTLSAPEQLGEAEEFLLKGRTVL